MGESSNMLQIQFEAFMKMYQENRQQDRTEREQLSARLEELSRELATTRLENQHGEDGSVNLGPRGYPHLNHRVEGRAPPPRFSRLEFPLYDGKIDPLVWLSRCEHYFRHQHTPEEEKVEIASYHLDADAQVWFLKLDRDRPGISWVEFKRQCQLRFGPSLQGNKLGELAKLRQGGTVEEYQRKFEQLAARASHLTTEQEVEIFISGLIEYIAIEVELHQPRDLISAMSLARLYERRSGARRTMPPQLKSPTVISSLPSNQRTFKRLSRGEMDERRAKGLCFNCDEIYNRGHQCKRLFWLDGVEESVQGELEDHDNCEDDTPEISLHAIIGEASGGNTMRVHGTIKRKRILFLIDSGSTHSFLDSTLVAKLGLNCTHQEGLQVVIANGSKIKSPGQCKNVPISLGTQLIQFDFYILTLNGIDAVLGVNWLQTLGPILWDFKVNSMIFKQHGRVLELKGADSSHTPPPVQLQVTTMAFQEEEVLNSATLQLLQTNIVAGEAVGPWEFKDGLIFFKKRVYLLPDSPIISDIIAALHNSGHEGYQKTLHRNAQDFYWKGMKASVQAFVRHWVAKLEAVDLELRSRDLILQDLRSRLLQAQSSMKSQYDAKHRPVQFQLGDQVLLKLQPHRQLSLSSSKFTKLSPRFYGPFFVLAKIGTVAYKLDLPSSSKLHPVFHVSCLKTFHGSSVPIEPTVPTLTDGELQPLPKAILDSRVVRNNHQVLVHWDGLSPADSSWEDVPSFQARFPSFALADKSIFNGGSNVMSNQQLTKEVVVNRTDVE
ncbi:hypothetical protein SADUNF_Sadunf18G0053900 [Salix dunnii]|uniref:Retrotransposon gag domain-containing protein n=1 Tax=Salix dunnii TaxID=1413687 RepID=A0A835J650_9ROSI|nr:hypothetical protein SADUNF_Sadunf18G0053900 [Salix dunnii]